MPAPTNQVKTLLVIHHSHTDVGYTEPQGRIALWHADFIRQALAAVAEGKKRQGRHLSGFKWVCETFWGVEQFMARASNAEIAAFREALRVDEIGLSASYLNFNELIADAVLRRVTRRAVDFGAKVGVAVDCAMTADINGYSWGFSQALHDCGVHNLFTCIHTHHGMYPLGKQQVPFWWETPQGDQVLVWSGEHYHFGNELGLVPGAVSSYLTKDECTAEMIHKDHWAVAEIRIPRYLEQLAARGYAYGFAPVMVSGLRRDNAPPNVAILDMITRWNETHGGRIRIEMATLGDFFTRLRAEPDELPVHRGDWPDWWSDGVASEPASTRLFRQAQRDHELQIRLAEKCGALPDVPTERQSTIDTQLALYAEHTFGHASAMSHPWHADVQAIAARKRAFADLAHEAIGRELATITVRLGAASLRPGLPFRFKVINPWDRPVGGIVRLPVGHHEYHENDLNRGAEIIDATSQETLPCQVEQVPQAAEFCVPLQLVAGAETTLELRPAGTSVEPELRKGVGSLVTDHVRISWHKPTGIKGWSDGKTGRDLLRADRPYPPLTLIHEITPVTAAEDMGVVRGAMQLNRKGAACRRSAARLARVGPVKVGPVFTAVELGYEVAGAQHCTVGLLAHAHSRRVDVAVRFLKESHWEPENLYLSLPFVPGAWPATLWLDKTGAAVRPRSDQIPGSLTDYYCIQEGLAVVTGKLGIAMAAPDSPLIQVGALDHGRRRLMGDSALARDPAHLFAWLMTNYWETNFAASLGGFHEFRFSVAWDEAYAEPAKALQACRDMNQGLVCFRLD